MMIINNNKVYQRSISPWLVVIVTYTYHWNIHVVSRLNIHFFYSLEVSKNFFFVVCIYFQPFSTCLMMIMMWIKSKIFLSTSKNSYEGRRRIRQEGRRKLSSSQFFSLSLSLDHRHYHHHQKILGLVRMVNAIRQFVITKKNEIFL